jgi:hypothetical protein
MRSRQWEESADLRCRVHALRPPAANRHINRSASSLVPDHAALSALGEMRLLGATEGGADAISDLPPALHLRLGQATPPGFIDKAQRPVGPPFCHSDKAVTLPFFGRMPERGWRSSVWGAPT